MRPHFEAAFVGCLAPAGKWKCWLPDTNQQYYTAAAGWCLATNTSWRHCTSCQGPTMVRTTSHHSLLAIRAVSDKLYLAGAPRSSKERLSRRSGRLGLAAD
eukprot:354887-Chlamydomonas_euryale.AAC.3